MSVTFYVLVGFLIGVTVMCGMVIAVSVGEKNKPQPRIEPVKPNREDLVYKKPKDYYTYDAKGRKRKVINVKYRD